MPDEQTDSTPGVDPYARIDALEAENADLRAKLAAYEPPPPPVQEYPKWVNGVIVPDRETEDAVLAGTAPPLELPKSASPNEHLPIQPSVAGQSE